MTSLFGSGPGVYGASPPTQRSRSWNNHGMYHNQDEHSYNGPNWAFTATASTFSVPVVDVARSRNSQNGRGSLLGRLVNGIADFVAPSGQAPSRNDLRGATRQPYTEEFDHSRDYRQSHKHGQHSQSPTRPAQRSARKPQSRRSASVKEYPSSDEIDAGGSHVEYTEYDSVKYRDRQNALKNTVDFHYRQAELARNQLEQACRQPMGNTAYLQELADRVASHETSMENALRESRQNREEKQQRRRSHRPRTHRQNSNTIGLGDDSRFNEPFNDLLSDPFFNHLNNPGSQQRFTHPLFARHPSYNASPQFAASPFAAFENLFADFDRLNRMHHEIHHSFFHMPSATFTASFEQRPQQQRRYTTTSSTGEHQYQQPRNFTAFAPQPSAPPASLLKPAEAQKLYKSYNERWNALSPIDANVPFPARGLNITNLESRNTLWAPSVSSPIETWSQETLMKANTQAFFLGAVGMRPAYAETAGAKIELGVDKTSGSPAQIQQLLDILKKERTRWHSDRLGKRNEGRPGANDALQKDERARAVYHGVCELIEAVQ